MNEEKMNEILLKLLEDVAVIRAKLDSIEEIKIDAKSASSRIDHLEAKNERQEKQISVLENRQSTLEEFTRNNLMDTKKTQTSVFISIGIAVLSALLTLVTNLI